MFFVIPSNIAKKEVEEDLFLHDKNATFHSASFNENFILFSMIIHYCVQIDSEYEFGEFLSYYTEG